MSARLHCAVFLDAGVPADQYGEGAVGVSWSMATRRRSRLDLQVESWGEARVTHTAVFWSRSRLCNGLNRTYAKLPWQGVLTKTVQLVRQGSTTQPGQFCVSPAQLGQYRTCNNPPPKHSAPR